MFVKNNSLSFSDGSPANLLLVGDNIHSLQYLMNEYKGKIKFIYIDPPYGCGGKKGKCSVEYNNFNERENLLSFLRERIKLAYDLLRDDGIFYLHCDMRNLAYFNILCNEIFGDDNFISILIWKRKNIGFPQDKHYSVFHDFILCFKKKDFILIKDKKIKQNYYRYEHNGKKCVFNQVKSRGISGHNFYTIINPDGIELTPNEGWNIKKENLLKKEKEGLIVWRENKYGIKYPYSIDYEKENNIKVLDYITESSNSRATLLLKQIFNNKNVFLFSKPHELIRYLLKYSTNKDDLILDFFAGSGSTGHAVLDLNKKDLGSRKFILCQNNEKIGTTPNGIAYDVTAKRLKRVMTGECYDGTKPEAWLKKNEPYGGSLDVYDYIE